VWTLRGKSRVHRLGRLWEEWEKAGVHLVEDGWKTPSGLAVFTDSGTYAPTFLVGSWTDSAGVKHVFLTDGYAATARRCRRPAWLTSSTCTARCRSSRRASSCPETSRGG
jgi:hypothetical protein